MSTAQLRGSEWGDALMLRFSHPLHLVLGFLIWSLWFVLSYAALSLACEFAAPADATGGLTWINALLLMLSGLTVTLLLYLAVRCWRSLRPASLLGTRAALVLATLLFAVSPAAFAHVLLLDDSAEDVASALSLVLLATLWLLHVAGSLRRPPAWPRLLCFHLAVALSVLAVVGPLDARAATSTSAHMVQHMLMMVVITPLWVFSRPLGQLITGGGGRALAGSSTPLLQFARHPMLAAWLHAAVIWFWHMPAFYTLALANPWWHLVEHLCFLLTAGLFWWAVLGSNRQNAAWALLAVLVTLMHTGFLGAMLTFAKAPLYLTPASVLGAAPRTLADQQLAGLLMWVAGGFPYLAAAAWIGCRWYQQLRRYPF